MFDLLRWMSRALLTCRPVPGADRRCAGLGLDTGRRPPRAPPAGVGACSLLVLPAASAGPKMPRSPTILWLALCLPLTERGPLSCRGSRPQHDRMLLASRQRACARTCGKPWGQVPPAVDYAVGVCGQPGRGWGQGVESENSIMPVTSLSDAARLWIKKKFRAERATECRRLELRAQTAHRPARARRRRPGHPGGRPVPAARRHPGQGPSAAPPGRARPGACLPAGSAGLARWCGGGMGYSWPRCRDPAHAQSVPRPVPQSRWSESCAAPGGARRSPPTGTATRWSCCCRAG